MNPSSASSTCSTSSRTIPSPCPDVERISTPSSDVPFVPFFDSSSCSFPRLKLWSTFNASSESDGRRGIVFVVVGEFSAVDRVGEEGSALIETERVYTKDDWKVGDAGVEELGGGVDLLRDQNLDLSVAEERLNDRLSRVMSTDVGVGWGSED